LHSQPFLTGFHRTLSRNGGHSCTPLLGRGHAHILVGTHSRKQRPVADESESESQPESESESESGDAQCIHFRSIQTGAREVIQTYGFFFGISNCAPFHRSTSATVPCKFETESGAFRDSQCAYAKWSIVPLIFHDVSSFAICSFHHSKVRFRFRGFPTSPTDSFHIVLGKDLMFVSVRLNIPLVFHTSFCSVSSILDRGGPRRTMWKLEQGCSLSVLSLLLNDLC